MFSKILIANRGEIAVRVIRACRELEIGTVAVFSEADRASLHVRYADEAYPIGPPPASQSYLRGERLVEVAKRAGAQAVHPGYGFLAENAAFAALCEEAGLTFIGPSSKAILAVGSKTAARRLASEAGVPIVPGGQDDLDDAAVAEAARALGFPVLIKASAGGGGKGMRIVRDEAELASAIRAARSEATASFGDPAIYIEKYLVAPRHIEMQVLADQHGTCLYLGERECSIQRRHQKLIEESPSPLVDAALRRELGQAAVRIAKAAGYTNAGTMEFLVDRERRFYFLEVNARLQVEHPVTEMVTGLDLVKAQIRIAAGERLDRSQGDIHWRGAALECRICAEDPFCGFVPSPGVIRSLRNPAGPGVRVESGVYAGYEVPIHYDSLIAKLIAWGEDRTEAIERMRRALAEYVIAGIRTTIPFHRHVVADPAFRRGEFDTTFIDERFGGGRAEEPGPDGEVALIAAAIHAARRAPRAASASGPPAQAAGEAWKRAGRLEGLRSR